ncbi:MAG TPA: hypothetical protein VMK65_02065 [Longimicrobiales bacterium]|nr:hypothetical protein [Longimicrobiales bacterium]
MGGPRIRAAALAVALAGCASARAGEPPAAPCTDAAGLERVVDAYFQLVSGPSGQRIPAAFTGLFLEDARMDAMGIDARGQSAFFPQSPSEYAHHVDEYRGERGFFQTPVSRATTCHARSASVDVWFESKNAPGGPLIDHGLLSMHLLRLEGGWRIAHVQWSSTPG